MNHHPTRPFPTHHMGLSHHGRAGFKKQSSRNGFLQPYGGFPKWVPENPIEMDDLGVPLF